VRSVKNARGGRCVSHRPKPFLAAIVDAIFVVLFALYLIAALA
jgi:hypothetical protein